jgi:hypothetical protein
MSRHDRLPAISTHAEEIHRSAKSRKPASGECIAMIGPIVVLVVICVTTAVIGGSRATTLASVQRLENMSVAKLVFPGAVQLRRTLQPQVQTRYGYTMGAAITTVYGLRLQGTPDKVGRRVIDWFDQRLVAQGWRSVMGAYPTEDFVLAESWKLTPDQFAVAIVPMSTAQAYFPAGGHAQYSVVFQVTLENTP